MSRVATIILSRNLPERADALYEQFTSQNNGETDIYLVESGTNPDLLSKYYTAWANWPEAIQNGLRYCRGFNYGLLQLMQDGTFLDYDYYFLVCNDITFTDPLVPVLIDEMDRHPRVGIISPCLETWPEQHEIGPMATRYVWHINHHAWMVRRDFVTTVMERVTPSEMALLYDGSNFRGYCADLELITKGYINEYATALTTRVKIREDKSLLTDQARRIATDAYATNRLRVCREGEAWMRRKYGFPNRGYFHLYAKQFYDRFFHLNPDLEIHRYD